MEQLFRIHTLGVLRHVHQVEKKERAVSAESACECGACRLVMMIPGFAQHVVYADLEIEQASPPGWLETCPHVSVGTRVCIGV